jgi:hypothetical protein
MVKFYYDIQRLKAIMMVKLQGKRWDFLNLVLKCILMGYKLIMQIFR